MELFDDAKVDWAHCDQSSLVVERNPTLSVKLEPPFLVVLWIGGRCWWLWLPNLLMHLVVQLLTQHTQRTAHPCFARRHPSISRSRAVAAGHTECGRGGIRTEPSERHDLGAYLARTSGRRAPLPHSVLFESTASPMVFATPLAPSPSQNINRSIFDKQPRSVLFWIKISSNLAEIHGLRNGQPQNGRLHQD